MDFCQHLSSNETNFQTVSIFSRGAHFSKKKKVIKAINVSCNFSWAFQKCKSYQCRTHPALSTHNFCPASLPKYLEQACWAEFVHCGGLSDQNIKKGTFARVEKLCLWEWSIKIHDIAGTPNYICTTLMIPFHFHGCFILKASSP